MDDWDEANPVYTVPDGVTLAAGAQITRHTGNGSNTASDLYWGRDAPVWNNGGDTVTVRTATGETVVQYSYN